jgi:hypothetical protein
MDGAFHGALGALMGIGTKDAVSAKHSRTRLPDHDYGIER